MGWEVGSFQRLKDKEQGGEKYEMNKELGNKYDVHSCLGIWGLASWIYCVSVQVEHSQVSND